MGFALAYVLPAGAISLFNRGAERVKPGNAFAATRWLIRVSLLATECVTFPFERLEKSPKPLGEAGAVAEVGDEPELTSNLPRVYKMSLSRRTSCLSTSKLLRGEEIVSDRPTGSREHIQVGHAL